MPRMARRVGALEEGDHMYPQGRFSCARLVSFVITAVTMLLLASLPLGIIARPCAAASYGDRMRDAVKRVLGKDPTLLTNEERGALVWFTFPTNNVGVPTTYELGKFGDSWKKSGRHLCSSWYCVGPEAPKSFHDTLTVMGTAQESQGMSISFTETEARDISVGFILPQIIRAFGLRAEIEKGTKIRSTLSADGAYVRRLDPKLYRAVISRDPEREKAAEEGRLAYVALDIVLVNLRGSIEIQDSANSNLRAGLDSSLTAGTKTIDNGQLSLAISSQNSRQGIYEFRSPLPLVVVAAPMSQRQKGSLTVVPEFEWQYEKLPELFTLVSKGDGKP